MINIFARKFRKILSDIRNAFVDDCWSPNTSSSTLTHDRSTYEISVIIHWSVSIRKIRSSYANDGTIIIQRHERNGKKKQICTNWRRKREKGVSLKSFDHNTLLMYPNYVRAKETYSNWKKVSRDNPRGREMEG